jgi:hypothetical protein
LRSEEKEECSWWWSVEKETGEPEPSGMGVDEEKGGWTPQRDYVPTHIAIVYREMKLKN